MDKAIKTATALDEANKAVEKLEENSEQRTKYDDQNEDHTKQRGTKGIKITDQSEGYKDFFVNHLINVNNNKDRQSIAESHY